MPQKKSRKEDAKKSVPKWSQYDDARKDQTGGKYPNYWTWKGREGHTELRDGSQGAESWTFQHRGGSMIQFMPDGAIQVVTHNGKHEITFGENRVKISGAHDVTVDGDGSYKTKGEGGYNQTQYGPSHVATGKSSVTVQKDVNILATRHFDVGAGSASLQTVGAMSFTGESVSMAAEKGMTFETGKGSIAMTAPDGVGGGGKDFAWSAQNQGNLTAGGQIGIRGGGMVTLKGSQIHLNGTDVAVAPSAALKPQGSNRRA